MATPDSVIVWFRRDLRLHDNPALLHAVKLQRPIVPLFIWDEAGTTDGPTGAASRWWLHHSLTALDQALQVRGSRLVIQQGPPAQALIQAACRFTAQTVLCNRVGEPDWDRLDRTVEAALSQIGVSLVRHDMDGIQDLDTVRNQSGKPYQVFTPFWKNFQTLASPSPPGPAPQALPSPDSITPEAGAAIQELRLLPRPRWDAGLAANWTPGETSARKQLERFLADALDEYHQTRDTPAQPGTSRLSPHLHFGEISPREVWVRVQNAPPSQGMRSFARQLGWREFSRSILRNHPEAPVRPLRPEFEGFPWRTAPEALAAWQQGQTGYPIVDAGMRELWQTGWMHNRVRMIVGSLLVKHLLISWAEGAAWFWDTLVDADLANNTMGWQWVGGCGADAAPFFRIFNPVTQSRKFDPQGHYIRRWIPEIGELPNALIHSPWDAPSDVLAQHRIALGHDYPNPIVDLGAGRRRALFAFASLKKERFHGFE